MTEKKSLQMLTSALSPQQQLAAKLHVENEFNRGLKLTTKTQDELAKEVGVSRQALHGWRNKPEFIEYQGYLSKVSLDSFRPVAHAQLLKLVNGTSNNGVPSIKGLELFFKLSGDLVNRSETTTTYIDESKPKLSPEQVSEGIEELARKLQGNGRE